MAENNQDLAVLGFRVRTTGADAAFRKILESLGTVESKFKETDKLLEDSITKSMKDLGAVVRGVNAAANSLNRNKGLFDAFDSLKTFATEAQNLKVDAKAIKEALEIMSNSRLVSMAKRLGDAFSTFERGTKVLEFEMKLANPDFLEKLQKDLLITIEPTTKAALSELKYSLDALAKGVIAKIIPDKESINALKQAVQDGIKPEIKFDENSKKIVGNLYSVIRDGVKQQGPILVPLQFTFGKPKSDHPSTMLKDTEQQARDDVRKTLEEYAKDFGGMGGLNAVWDKAILGGPEAIEKIRRVLATRTGWLETAVGESLDKAMLKPSKYGELVEQGLESIPVDVANTVDKLASQLKGLLKRHQDEFTFRPEIGTATQSEEDIKGVLADLASRVQKVSKKEFNSLPIPIGSVTLRPNNVLVSPVDAKTVFFATESIDADIKEAVLRPKSIKIDASAIPEGKTQLVGGEAFTAASKQISIPVPSVFIKPQNLLVSPLADEVAFLGESIAADVKETVLYPDKITIDASVLEQKNIKVTPDMLKTSVKSVVGTPKSITIDTTAIPSDKVTTVGGRLGVNTNEILVHPRFIKVDAAFVNPDNVSLINGDTIADALQREPLKITTKIKLDPLPKDEIDKLDKLVTRLHDVETAYGNIVTVAARLRDTVKDLDAAMSAEVKALIKADSKVAVKALQESSREAKQAAKAQVIMDDLLNAYTNGSSDSTSRRKLAKDEMDALEKLDRASGMYADNLHAYNQDLDKAKEKFDALKPSVDAYAASLSKAATDNAQQLRASVRQFAKDSMQASQALAKATADAAKYGKGVRDASIAMQNFGRVTKLNIADPLARMKAELGETNSRLIDLGRTFGLYLSGRTIINYFRQASDAANNFQYEIRRIQSLATDFDFGELRNGLMDIDARFGNVVHNASALYWAFSSGVRGSEKDLINFTEIMSKTATTIKADVMPTLDAATSIMNAWNLSANSAREIGDLLFGIVKYGKSNAQQLTTSLGHVVAPAAALNIELNELGAAAATLTKTMKTNRAFTYLSNILGKMASPTKAVQEAAAEMGIELSASAIKARGFANTLADIRKATGGDIAKIARIFPDLRGQRAAITLLSTQYGDFVQQLENMRNKAGSMEEALSKIADTPEAQLRALRNTFSMLSIEAGNTVNSMITLGGVLGPVLEKVNGLGHAGRAALGNVIATAAAWAGMAVTMKAIQASQFAMAQMAYQQASAAAELRKTELDTSLLKEKQALENGKIALTEMQARIAAAENNDEQLRSMKSQADTLKTVIAKRRRELAIMRQEAKLSNVAMAPALADAASQLGQSSARIQSLEHSLNILASDDDAKKIRETVNLIGRMNAALGQSKAAIEFEDAKTAETIRKTFMSLVESSREIQQNMQDALLAGNRGDYEKYKETFQSIVGIIKNNTVIASALNQNDRGEDYLRLLVQGRILSELKMEAVSGEAFQHNLVIDLVKEALRNEKEQLKNKKLILEDTVRQSKATEEDLRQLQLIEQRTADIVAFETQHLDVTTAINERTNALVGTQKEQAAVLAENIKNMKAWLDADTTDTQTLKANLEASLKAASVYGKSTLAATREAYEAEMLHNSIIMQQRSIMTEILSLTDKNGNLLDDSEQTHARVTKLMAEQLRLTKEAVAARQQFVTLGARTGNQDAVNSIIDQYQRNSKAGFLNPSLRKKYLAVVADRLKLDEGVQSEMMRAMARDMGKSGLAGFFGGNAMRSASMMMSFMPGMQRWAMPLNMMSSLNVVGKAQQGFAGLSGAMTRMLVSAESLKKKGVLALDKNIVSLTKTFIENVAWTKKQAFANKALMSMSTGTAAAKNGIANAAVASTWLTAGVGGLLVTAIAGALALAFSKTEKGGPLGGIAEQLYGLDDKKRYGEYLDLRLEMMKAEQTTNDDMIREMNRMISATSNIQDNLLNIAERNRMLESLQGLQQYGNARQKVISIAETKRNIANLENEIESINASITGMALPGGGIISQNSFDKQRLDKMKRELEEKRTQLAESQDIVNKEYPKLLESIAESRYQSLREMLESDRDAAFMPKKNAADQLRLAEKMTAMAKQRLADALGNGPDLADLTGKTTDEIREMIRNVIMPLSTAREEAEDAWKEAQLVLKGMSTDDKKYEEQERKVNELKEKFDEASKNFDERYQGIRNASSDFYQKIIAQSEASVKSVQEDIQKTERKEKFQDLFRSYDTSLKVQDKNILKLRKEMKKLEGTYKKEAEIYGELNKQERDDTFRDNMQKLVEMLRSIVTNRANSIKNLATQMDSFMTGLASDMEAQAKSLFDYKMGNPLYAGLRDELINERKWLLDELLYGQNGAEAMRNNALREMERLRRRGDLGGAQKQLQEASRWQKKGMEYEREKLDLVKRQADIEKDIGASMYQLANTLRGQFAATTQQAIEADSIEAMRLRSQVFEQNVAPSINIDYQTRLAKMYEDAADKNAQWSQELQQAASRLVEDINKAAGDSGISGAAINIRDAGTDIKSAAGTFKEAAESVRTIINIKRI